MGICSSCLGGGRRDDYEDDGGRDEERLLFDDPNAIAGYGSFEPPVQEDLESQREMESLQRVVARTAHNMVDIFEIAPQDPMTVSHAPPAPFAYGGQGSRVARYKHLAARLSAIDSSETSPDQASVGVDWISTDDEDDYDYVMMDQSDTAALQLPDRPLVGTFADAAAAMTREG